VAYDATLTRRLRVLLEGLPGFSERRMFGGVCFMLSGRMCCGVVGSDLVVRVGPEAHDRALLKAAARPMDFTGRPLRGFVYVGPAGYQTERGLKMWTRRAVRFVSGLPPRPKVRAATRGRRAVYS